MPFLSFSKLKTPACSAALLDDFFRLLSTSSSSNFFLLIERDELRLGVLWLIGLGNEGLEKCLVSVRVPPRTVVGGLDILQCSLLS